jgi:rhodanese-related sulfurtransferase
VAHSRKYAQFDHAPSKVQAKEALDRAFSLEPDLGDAWFADGMYRYRVLRDNDQALEAFQKARDRGANRALAVEYSSYVKRRQGKWDEALQLHAESLDLDPRNPNMLAEVADTYCALRRFDEAQSLIDRARELSATSPIVVYCHHGVRSLSGAAILQQAGFEKVASMRGGIEAWSLLVDPSVPRY